MLAKKRYGNKKHWTDLFSYFYLAIGVLLMFGPVLWLGLSSFKTAAGLTEYPPTFLPLAQVEVVVEGYKKPLLLYNVKMEDGSVMELAEIRRVGIISQMVDPNSPKIKYKIPIENRERIREFKMAWENYTEPLERFNFFHYQKTPFELNFDLHPICIQLLDDRGFLIIA